MAEFFDKENHGRKAWARVQPSHFGRDDEKNPNLVKVDENTGEKKRIFYGYLGTASDMEKFDFDTKKKVTIESLREYLSKQILGVHAWYCCVFLFILGYYCKNI